MASVQADYGPKVSYRTVLTYNNTSANQNFTPSITQQYDDELGIMRFVYDSVQGWQEFRFVFLNLAVGSTHALSDLVAGDIAVFSNGGSTMTLGNNSTFNVAGTAGVGNAGMQVSKVFTLSTTVDGAIAGKNSIAGVAIQAQVANLNCWLQTKGLVTALIAGAVPGVSVLQTSAAFTFGVNVTGVTCAVGDQLIHSGTSGVATNASNTLNTAPTNEMIGYVVQANTGSGDFCGARLNVCW